MFGDDSSLMAVSTDAVGLGAQSASGQDEKNVPLPVSLPFLLDGRFTVVFKGTAGEQSSKRKQCGHLVLRLLAALKGHHRNPSKQANSFIAS